MAIWSFDKPTHLTPDGKQAWINLSVDKVKAFKKAHQMIEIKLPQGYCRPVDPSNLLKYGKKTKATFLYTDNPMKLVGGYFTIMSPEEKEAEFYKLL